MHVFKYTSMTEALLSYLSERFAFTVLVFFLFSLTSTDV